MQLYKICITDTNETNVCQYIQSLHQLIQYILLEIGAYLDSI